MVNNLLDPYHRLIIAYSGGLDSHVLLHQLSKRANILAVYVHHGLQDEADDWQQHCQQVCAALNVPFQAVSVQVEQKAGHSLEASAREQRYQALADFVNTNDALLTAHHLDDQAETVLLQLMRGAGPKGLSAMPLVKPFFKGVHIRPLLDQSREQLLQYAKQHQLKWIEDPSNQQHQFDRNFIRHEILPRLKQRWPQVLESVNRSSVHCASSVELLDELAKMDLSICHSEHPTCHSERSEEPHANSTSDRLPLKKLAQFSQTRQQNLIRYWLHTLHYELPSTSKLNELLDEMHHAAQDKNPLIQWGAYEARRYQGYLYVMPRLQPFDHQQIIKWDLQQDLVLPNNLGTIHLSDLPDDLDCSQRITIRFRQGGEPGLKKQLQEQGIPPWLRDRVPLLYQEERFVQFFIL